MSAYTRAGAGASGVVGENQAGACPGTVALPIHLVNGSTRVRERNSEGCAVLPCGCAHDERQWLQLCDVAFHLWGGRHMQARLSHDDRL